VAECHRNRPKTLDFSRHSEFLVGTGRAKDETARSQSQEGPASKGQNRYADLAMGLIPILLIVALVLLLLRGRGRAAPPGTGVSGRDPIRLILFIVLVLVIIVLVVNVFAPLGNYRF
jgi:hypothetical protein